MRNATPVRLVVLDDVLASVGSSASSRPVYGAWRPTERLIQALALEPCGDALRSVGSIHVAHDDSRSRGDFQHSDHTFHFTPAAGVPAPKRVEVTPGLATLESRREGLVNGRGLSETTVGIIGCGSFGSLIAMLLGQAGVGRFLLVDCDALDVSNVSRHVLDLSDVGRRKVDALAERLRLRGAQCSAHDLDLTTTDPMRLAEILTACGLVVCTVDVPSASFIVNEVLVEHAVAGLFAGAYEEAAAGEIIAVRPGGGHCLYCAVGFRTGLIPEVNVRARQEAYRNADSARLVAEPGLAIDITYLASVAAAHALALLDPSGNRAQLLGSGFSLVHGPSAPRASNPFRAPMDFLHARVSRSEQCPVCRSPVAAR